LRNQKEEWGETVRETHLRRQLQEKLVKRRKVVKEKKARPRKGKKKRDRKKMQSNLRGEKKEKKGVDDYFPRQSENQDKEETTEAGSRNT